MSFPNKESRQICWDHKDQYWKCLDDGKTEAECKEFRKQYEKFCSSQWVKHFDRKREYLKFKEQLEKEGTHNLDGRQYSPNKSDESIQQSATQSSFLGFQVTKG